MILEQLNMVPSLESPKLVFAHITAPHPPFVFGPNGEPRPAKSFKDGNYYEGTTQEYIEGYRGQVAYLNQRLVEIIDHILENSDPEPIIILQADHGPGAYLNWDSVEATCLQERMSILNAYYLPGQDCDQFPEAITPVNSFRLIFDRYFNTGVGFTSDQSYFSLWSAPYELIDITDSIDSCNHPSAVE